MKQTKKKISFSLIFSIIVLLISIASYYHSKSVLTKIESRMHYQPTKYNLEK